MDETDYLLSSAENAKRLKKSAKELEEGTKGDLFGIWADKAQDVDVRDMWQLLSIVTCKICVNQ